MKESMSLKEFIDGLFETSPMGAIQAGGKLIELEAIENWLNLMYGVNLDIRVIPTEQKEGRFYGKSLIEKIK